MTERTAHILEAAVQEFINTGNPVSSGLLYEKHDFGIKPAMIRLELDDLEEGGYLEQPHHSAGRVPTNAGYEFFAKRMMQTAADARRENREREARRAAAAAVERSALPDFLNRLSAELGLLSVAADLAREAVYKAGLEQLINRLDWQDQEGIRSVIHDFEKVDARLPRVAPNVGEGPQVYIGKKSPVTKSENLSVVGGNYRVGNATVSIFVIGPKRMDYKKVIRIFNNF